MVPSDALRAQRPASNLRAAARRIFFSATALAMLGVMLAGFYPYYLHGEGMGGRQIAPELRTLVFAHGSLMTAWIVTFLVQALLIASRRRSVHMTLGWGGMAIAAGVTVSGLLVAIESVRPSPEFPFWGMAYGQFLLVMLSEVTLFTLFVAAGVWFRKRPDRHRAMMLLASLSILAGATVRMPMLFPLFGTAGFIGIFGPIAALGAIFLGGRSLLTRGFDRWLAAGYVAMVVFYAAVCQIALTDAWGKVATAILTP